jgi:hypothetical protein
MGWFDKGYFTQLPVYNECSIQFDITEDNIKNTLICTNFQDCRLTKQM